MQEPMPYSAKPWRESQGYIFASDSSDPVGWLVRGKRTDEERFANSRLIVNAPETMETLMDVVDELDGLLSTIESDFGGYDHETLQKVERAQNLIYKVTGHVVGRPSAINELADRKDQPIETPEHASDTKGEL